MGRLRATLATSSDDREMQECLNRAGRALSDAMDVCEKNLRSHGGRYASNSPESRPTLEAIRFIKQLTDQVGRVPHLFAFVEPPPPMAVDTVKWEQAEAVAAKYDRGDNQDFIQQVYERMDPGFRRRQGAKSQRVMQDWRRKRAAERPAPQRSNQEQGNGD